MKLVYDKKCPICGNTKMIKSDPKEAHNSLRSNDSIALNAFIVAYTMRYVCYECGYQMDFYEDEQLDKLRKKVNK